MSATRCGLSRTCSRSQSAARPSTIFSRALSEHGVPARTRDNPGSIFISSRFRNEAVEDAVATPVPDPALSGSTFGVSAGSIRQYCPKNRNSRGLARTTNTILFCTKSQAGRSMFALRSYGRLHCRIAGMCYRSGGLELGSWAYTFPLFGLNPSMNSLP